MALEEFKQSIIEHMDFGIKHTDLQDAYSIGFRNGIRWCKSLIDEVEPIYDSIADTPQTEDDYFLELMDAVERGEMSDASANQAYYEYINKQAEESDTPQTDCGWK